MQLTVVSWGRSSGGEMTNEVSDETVVHGASGTMEETSKEVLVMISSVSASSHPKT